MIEVCEWIFLASNFLMLGYCGSEARFLDPLQLSKALSFLLGPSLSIIVPLYLLLKLAEPMMQTPGGDWIDVESNPDHQQHACMSPLGYVPNLSGLAGNLSMEYYVFLYITLTLFPLVFLAYMPPLLVWRPPRGGVRGGVRAFLTHPFPSDALSPYEFLAQQWLIRLSLVSLIYTGIVPYWLEGNSKL